jgi:plasmid stabilization system protein ParE
MKRILISEDALGDLNAGFLFYEAQDFGLGDYFTACLRADIEGLRFTAGIHREIQGFHRLLSRVFPHGIFYTVHGDTVRVLAVIDLRRNPEGIAIRLNKKPIEQ